MKLLDAGEQGERTWAVKTQALVERLTPGGDVIEMTGEHFIHVKAIEMSIEDGALVFRGKGGELSWVFGPNGWLEVSRA